MNQKYHHTIQYIIKSWCLVISLVLGCYHTQHFSVFFIHTCTLPFFPHPQCNGTRTHVLKQIQLVPTSSTKYNTTLQLREKEEGGDGLGCSYKVHIASYENLPPCAIICLWNYKADRSSSQEYIIGNNLGLQKLTRNKPGIPAKLESAAKIRQTFTEGPTFWTKPQTITRRWSDIWD